LKNQIFKRKIYLEISIGLANFKNLIFHFHKKKVRSLKNDDFHDDVTCCLSKKTYDHDIIIITPQPPLFNFNDWLCFYMNPQQNSAIYIQGNLTEKISSPNPFGNIFLKN